MKNKTISTERNHSNLASLAQEVKERGHMMAVLMGEDNYTVGFCPISGRTGLAVGERINLTPGHLAKGTIVAVIQ